MYLLTHFSQTANHPPHQRSIKYMQPLSVFQPMEEGWKPAMVLERLAATLSVDFVAGGMGEMHKQVEWVGETAAPLCYLC